MNQLQQMLSRFSLLGAVMLSTACQPNFEIFTADEFADLGSTHSYAHRSATPDGLVIAVREKQYDVGQGDLEFWSKAVENEMRLDQGYALVGKEEFTTKKGVPGVKLRFGVDRDEVAHEYIVGLFVVKKGKKMRLFVVECGGREGLVERHRAQIDWTLSEFIAR